MTSYPFYPESSLKKMNPLLETATLEEINPLYTVSVPGKVGRQGQATSLLWQVATNPETEQ